MPAQLTPDQAEAILDLVDQFPRVIQAYEQSHPSSPGNPPDLPRLSNARHRLDDAIERLDIAYCAARDRKISSKLLMKLLGRNFTVAQLQAIKNAP